MRQGEPKSEQQFHGCSGHFPVDFRPTRVPDLIKFYEIRCLRFSEAPLVAGPLIKGFAAGAPPLGTSSSLLTLPPSQRAGSFFLWRTIQKPQAQPGASEVHGDPCLRLGHGPLCEGTVDNITRSPIGVEMVNASILG